MKNSERTNRSFKAIAVVLILGLTIVYNSDSHLNTFKDEVTQNLDTTQQTIHDEPNSTIEILSLTSKLFVSGVKQFISNH